MQVMIAVLAGLVVVETAAIVALLVRQSRRKKAQESVCAQRELFHEMFDRAPVMLWTARPDTTLSYLNQTCVEFTGHSVQSLAENGWLDLVHPDDVEASIAFYTPVVEARQPLQFQFRLRRADGVYRWIQDKAVPTFRSDGSYLGYVGCSVDITEYMDAEAAKNASSAVLAANHHEIQQLAGRLLTAHEDERRHLACELHDDLTQRLALMAIDIGQMEQAPVAPGALRSLREDLVKLSEDVHALSYRLHPSILDDLGLVEALRAECERVARRGSMSVHVDVDTKGQPLLMHADASLCLFRIAQEAMSNATRHARASSVVVHLARERVGYQLAVVDNGDGFDPFAPRDHASLGLASMRERVRVLDGELDIKSAPGEGTTVTAWVPA